MSAEAGKDVVYVDVDDEITGVIDKVTTAKSKVVALVLPKRATVFQSIVNMKLLKKRAEVANKNVVLITSETGLLPLAGNVGIHVAKTLQSKPEIPAAFSPLSDDSEEVDEDADGDFDAAEQAATPVGALAGAKSSINDADDDAVELDNSEMPEGKTGGEASMAALAAAGGTGKATKGKGKKLSVPNFNRFRKLLVFGVLALILLVVGVIYAVRVLPKATVTIKTNTSTVNADLTATLDTAASAANPESATIPAQLQQQKTTNTAQATATGKKNNGDKATGSATMAVQVCSPPYTAPNEVPAGTGLSTNGLTFITQSTTSFGPAPGGGPGCVAYASHVNIIAQSGGTQSNVGSGTSFTVAGRPDVSATGSASGGKDNIVTVVQQSDIDSATTQLKGKDDADAIKQQLKQQLQNAGLYPIEATFHASQPSISPSVQAGQPASNVTVTEGVTYTMYGAKKSDIQAVLDANINQQIDPAKQSIQSDGLSQNSFNVPNAGSGKTLQVGLQTAATVGPHIDVNALKEQLVGKKSGDAETLIKALPGVTDAKVKYSPFWVSSAPAANKITITFKK